MKPERVLPKSLFVERGQTQKNVNCAVLETVASLFPTDADIKILDLPCGNMEFLSYLRTILPNASLLGADLVEPKQNTHDLDFVAMDLTEPFSLPTQPQFDLITSVSGVMMFSNTLSFIRNCSTRLKPGGSFIVTNDNSATIIDRIAYLFFGRYRIFRPVYDDTEEMTENVPVQELCRLLRTHGVSIERIQYTSFYLKDLLYLPFALLVYPLQLLYLLRLRTTIPAALKWQMYPFRHLFCKHYIITGQKAT